MIFLVKNCCRNFGTILYYALQALDKVWLKSTAAVSGFGLLLSSQHSMPSSYSVTNHHRRKMLWCSGAAAPGALNFATGRVCT